MNRENLDSAFKPMILSASGWRKVFALSGEEEDFTPEISSEDRLLSAAMAQVFSGLLLSKGAPDTQGIYNLALGTDSRPTGPAMAKAMIPVFLSHGIKVKYTGICAAPEIMAWTGTSSDLAGFCYISASHNPVGHNGVKFGLGGGVIGGDLAVELIAQYRDLIADEKAMLALEELLLKEESSEEKGIIDHLSTEKAKSYKCYYDFTRLVASQKEGDEQKPFFDLIKEKISQRPLGIVAEQNGSARSLTIDKEYLTSLGIKVLSLNDKPGQIVHPIIPEGESLSLCRSELERAHAEDPAFLLGYVPDNDGDRGNLVYFNEIKEQAVILEAQEVFALSVLSELTGLLFQGQEMSQVAVAVNGPTSLRIEQIAQTMGAAVARAEVGEANVVNLAANLRDSGKVVRILGEGSNGGNITHPAQVRDPLNTLGALINLLSLTSTSNKKGLFELWCEKSGQSHLYQEDFTLSHIIASLPAYTTTSAFEPRAIMKINSESHGKLKATYEDIFPQEWLAKKDELSQRFGIESWEEYNMEGTQERLGVGPSFRSGRETGGFKILFKDKNGRGTDYIWMRGSGTEPVFRVLADCLGDDPKREAWFLAWHKSIIEKADKELF